MEHHLNLDEKSKLPLVWLGGILLCVIGATTAFSRIENKSELALAHADAATQSINNVESKMDGIINRLNSIDSRLSRIEGSLERGGK